MVFGKFIVLLRRCSFRSPGGRKAGNRHIEKALSQRLICGVQNFATSKSNRTIGQCSMPIGLCIQFFVHSVGFGIAYLWLEGMRRPCTRDER